MKNKPMKRLLLVSKEVVAWRRVVAEKLRVGGVKMFVVQEPQLSESGCKNGVGFQQGF